MEGPATFSRHEFISGWRLKLGSESPDLGSCRHVLGHPDAPFSRPCSVLSSSVGCDGDVHRLFLEGAGETWGGGRLQGTELGLCSQVRGPSELTA